ncbi:hypothetical protein C8J56DRAFT_900473 [Mycena floridula]|nr:hypothetical protein C8J56DRAFT_900473 [Mycena floridula]
MNPLQDRGPSSSTSTLISTKRPRLMSGTTPPDISEEWSLQDLADAQGAVMPILLDHPSDAWIWKRRDLYFTSLKTGTYCEFIVAMTRLYVQEFQDADRDAEKTNMTLLLGNAFLVICGHLFYKHGLDIAVVQLTTLATECHD